MAPPTAQAAMHHSSLDLTVNIYIGPSLLDVASALECLPDLALSMLPSTRGSTAPNLPRRRQTAGSRFVWRGPRLCSGWRTSQLRL